MLPTPDRRETFALAVLQPDRRPALGGEHLDPMQESRQTGSTQAHRNSKSGSSPLLSHSAAFSEKQPAKGPSRWRALWQARSRFASAIDTDKMALSLSHHAARCRLLDHRRRLLTRWRRLNSRPFIASFIYSISPVSAIHDLRRLSHSRPSRPLSELASGLRAVLRAKRCAARNPQGSPVSSIDLGK